MDYGKILKRSAELTWRNKLLWALGILVALFSGGVGGNPTLGMQYSAASADLERMFRNMPFLRQPFGSAMPNWGRLAALGAGVIALLFVAALVLSVMAAIVRYTAEGALVSATDDVDRGEKPVLRQLLSRGWSRFLRLFVQDLIIGVVGVVIFVVAMLLYALIAAIPLVPGILLINAGQAARVIGIIWVVIFGLALVFLFIALLGALSAAFTIVRQYAVRHSVLRLQDIFDALGGAIDMFKRTWRQSVAMWLWLALVSVGVTIVLVPVVGVLVAVIVAPSAGMYALSRSPALTALVAIPLYLLVAIVALLATGLLTAFRATVWTLTFNELMPEQETSAAIER